MKIKTPFFELEIEWLLLIVIFITILSPKLAKLITPFFICYSFIFFHELSHIFVASIVGKKMEKLKLSLSGVCVSFEKERYLQGTTYYLSKYITDLLVYLAGPVSNIVLAMLFRHSTLIFQLNMSLAIINLIPVYPLDGYNIFKSILCILKIGNNKSEIISEIISNIVFILSIILAILVLVVVHNFSMFIFIMYLYLLKKEKNKKLKFTKLITNLEQV